MKSCERHFKQRIKNIWENLRPVTNSCYKHIHTHICYWLVFINVYNRWNNGISAVGLLPVKHKQGLHSICASNQKLFPRHHVSHSVENQPDLSVLTQAKTGKKRSLSALLQMDAHRTQCNITDLPKHINTYIKHSSAMFLLALWSVEVA